MGRIGTVGTQSEATPSQLVSDFTGIAQHSGAQGGIRTALRYVSASQRRW